MKKNDNIPKNGEERKGFWKVGYLENQDYPRRVFELTRKPVDVESLDETIDNLISEGKQSYYDTDFNPTKESDAVYVFFPTGQKAFYRNKDIFGGFHRVDPKDRWKGVYLEQDLEILKTVLENQRRRSALEDYTYIYDYNHIARVCNEEFPEAKTVEDWANYIGEVFTKCSTNNEIYSFSIGSFFPAETLSENGEKMYFWMEKNDKYQAKQKGFGLNLISEQQLLEKWCNIQHKYTLGRLVFPTWESMEHFVAEVAQTAMPENWDRLDTGTGETQFGYPVLKSYLEYTLIRLRYLDKTQPGYILRENGKVYYNTGLLNKFFRQILVGASLKTIKQSVPGIGEYEFEFFHDPYLIVSGHDTKFPTENGLHDFPKLANYFEKKEDVLYDASLEIMLNDEHIFEDGLAEGRIPMFRDEYEKCKDDPDELKSLHIRVQSRVQTAIQRARLLAERNHKLALPQFWKEKSEVQFLLPLYMEETEYTGRPQCALALRRSKSGRYYEGATILSLDMAYSNARLIARPDVTWLNRGEVDELSSCNFKKMAAGTPVLERELVPCTPLPELLPVIIAEEPEKKPEKQSEPKQEKEKEIETRPVPENIGKEAMLTNIVSRPSGKGLKGDLLGSSGTVARSLLKHPVPHYTKGTLKVKIVEINPQGNQYILEPIEK